jgi:Cupin superfamily protein
VTSSVVPARSFSGSPWPPSPDFWNRDFTEATDGGVTPFLFKGLLPSTFPNHDELASALSLMQQQARGQQAMAAHLRVYLDEERHDDLVAQVLGAAISNAESIPSFARRVTGADRFCIVINNLEVLSALLAAEVGVFLQSMFETRGVPIGGCEQVAFAGNYEGTPFGVHEGYEHAFLFHLGPGPKDFYCWSSADYVRLTGGREPTFGDYRWLLPEAQHFAIEPGDVLYLPAHVYHVAKLTDYAVSVTVPMYTYPSERYFLRAILPDMAEFLLGQVDGHPSPHQALSYDSSPLRAHFAPLADDLMRRLAGCTRDHLGTALGYRWYRVVSNGGWEIADHRALQVDDDTPVPQGVDAGSTLLLRRPYKLCWSRMDCASGQVRVFLRGQSVVVEDHEKLPAMFRALNEGKHIRLDVPASLLEAFRTIAKTGGFDSGR